MKHKVRPPSTDEKITNTEGRHPGPTVPGIPIGQTVGASAILAQEAQGTREVAAANGTRLPIDGTTSVRDQLNCAHAGIKLGAPVSGDPLFRLAELPPGWRTVPSSDDSRTTDILDANGNRRGSIWYKAASYDRRASFHLICRYDVTPHWPDLEKTGRGSVVRRTFIVKDNVTGKALWTGKMLHRPDWTADRQAWDDYEKAELATRKMAIAWLGKNFPDHDNVGAYWGAP